MEGKVRLEMRLVRASIYLPPPPYPDSMSLIQISGFGDLSTRKIFF